jgi:hypothetical protein
MYRAQCPPPAAREIRATAAEFRGDGFCGAHLPTPRPPRLRATDCGFCRARSSGEGDAGPVSVDREVGGRPESRCAVSQSRRSSSSRSRRAPIRSDRSRPAAISWYSRDREIPAIETASRIEIASGWTDAAGCCGAVDAPSIGTVNADKARPPRGCSPAGVGRPACDAPIRLLSITGQRGLVVTI